MTSEVVEARHEMIIGLLAQDENKEEGLKGQ